MSFSVKATLVAFLADAERYPCHAMLNIGDEVTFDGAEIKGKMCPHVVPQLTNAMIQMFMCGPRYINPGYYNLFWYASNSVSAPEKAIYDGNGFTPVLEAYDEPRYHTRCLQDPNAFQWPPAKGRPVAKDATVICPDSRTSAMFKVEAYDLATAGDALPYTRRQITMMDRVAKNGGKWPVEKIMDLYTDFEKYEIYPPMSNELIVPMLEELEVLGYAEIVDGEFAVTKLGEDRVARYKAEIPEEDAKSLKL